MRTQTVRSTCALVIICSFWLAGPRAAAQDAAPDPISAVPVLSGGIGIVPSYADGQFTLVNIVSPVVLVPIGEKLLIESRAAFEAPYTRQPDGSFGGKVEKDIEYLQLDYIANRYVTFTAGRFLTPFGIYSERVYPVWIRNLQTDPLILPFGYGSSDGAMMRGGFSVAPNLNLNYAAYFSAQSSVSKFESDRSLGTRLGVFLPRQRLEIGGSFQHLLYEDRSNRYGLHFEWQPRSQPLDIRAEFADGRFAFPLGRGGVR
jgi:hypothetical protein